MEGINAENVARFFRARVPGGDVELDFSLISGGRSNLTYRVRAADASWVLRRPPLGHVLPTAHDMAREYRVLSALADTDVPVAAADRAVRGRGGQRHALLRDGVPARHRARAGAAGRFRRHAGGAAAHQPGARSTRWCALHAIDYRAVGLEDFGHPEGYLERQVRRWGQQWERSKTAELPEIES